MMDDGVFDAEISANRWISAREDENTFLNESRFSEKHVKYTALLYLGYECN